MANISAIKLPNGTTYTIKDNNALPLTGGSVTGSVSFGDSVTMDEATVGDLVVNGSGSFTNNLQVNTINGVTVGNSPKFTDTNTEVSTFTLAAGTTAGTALAHGGKYTLTAGSKTVSFTMPAAQTIPTATNSATTGISVANHSTTSIYGVSSSTTSVYGVSSTTTTASKVTLGTAKSIPNVTSAGSASTWTFESKSIPNVTAAGSASTWTFESKTVMTDLTMTINSTDSGQLDIAKSTTTVYSKSGGGNGTAPTLGTAITVYSKSGGGNGMAPTLGTAISVPNVTEVTDVTVPIKNADATTVPIKNTSATTVVTSATHSVTDNGHTHTI